MLKAIASSAAIISIAVLSACGGSEDIGAAPDVRGLVLPDAEAKLERAGYSASVSDDAMFGVLVPSHYTVCSESSPEGKLVPIDVSKDC